MGNATTRTLERVAAAVGMLASAPIEFQTAWDVPQGGVLLALPALLAQGLLRYSPQMYHLPDGFYGIDSIKRRASGAKSWAWIASRKCGRYAKSCDCCAGIWGRP